MLGYFLCSLLISSLSVNFGSKRWRKDGWLTAMLLYGSKSDIARFCLNSHLSSVVYTAPLGQPNCWWPINRHFLLAAAIAPRHPVRRRCSAHPAEKNRCSIASHIAYSIVQYIRRHCIYCKGPLSDQDLNWGNPTCAYK